MTLRRPRLLAVLPAAAALLVLSSACGSEASVDEGGEAPTTSASAAGEIRAEPPIAAATTTAAEARWIRVTGVGEVRAQPNVATVTTGVSVRAETVALARTGAANVANAVIASLRAHGVEERDMRTVDFSINPYYDRSVSPRRFLGYSVSTRVQVTVRDLDRIGEIIDATADAGGDSISFESISFAHDGRADFVQQARDLAMDAARAKAEQLAEHAGVSLGPVISIVDTSRAPRVALAEAETDAPVAGHTGWGTAIQPGTSGVTVDVTVVWAIADDEDLDRAEQED